MTKETRDQTIVVTLSRPFIKHALRTFANNLLREQGVCLRRERPRLIEKQGGLCPICIGPLTDDGTATHVDHVVTVKEFTDRVYSGALTFDQAYVELWSDENLQAVHAKCNYSRNVKVERRFSKNRAKGA